MANTHSRGISSSERPVPTSGQAGFSIKAEMKRICDDMVSEA